MFKNHYWKYFKKILFKENSIDVEKALPDALIYINKDGKIDKAEYSTSILAADLLSKPEGAEIDGTINNQGMNAVQELTKKANAQEASAVYTALYNKYNLG